MSTATGRPAQAKPPPGERPTATSPAPQKDGPPGGFRWVPVRSMAPRHRPRILVHLTKLSERDRTLRFGYSASDEQIGRYVDRLDFERDEVFGVFNRRLDLVAVAHLACPGDSDRTAAEFGVSVSAHLRGRGIGARLFDHTMLHARNRGINTLRVHALSENAPMLHIARNAGATIKNHGGDSEACLKLPREDLASRLAELLEGGAAQLDYSLKHQAHKVDALLSSLAEVANRVKSGQVASE